MYFSKPYVGCLFVLVILVLVLIPVYLGFIKFFIIKKNALRIKLFLCLGTKSIIIKLAW